MSSNTEYIKFDKTGVIGPILTLLYQPNNDQLESTSSLIETNYFQVKGVKLKHREEFCREMRKSIQKTIQDRLKNMMNTEFIKGLYPLRNRCCCKSKPAIHEKIHEFIVPAILGVAKEFIPEMENNHPTNLYEFLTSLCEGYLQEQVIKDQCYFFEVLPYNSEYESNLRVLNKKLHNNLVQSNIKEIDLNAILDGISGKSQVFLEECSNPILVKELVDEYHTCCKFFEEGVKKKITEIIYRILDKGYRFEFFHNPSKSLQTKKNQ